MVALFYMLKGHDIPRCSDTLFCTTLGALTVTGGSSLAVFPHGFFYIPPNQGVELPSATPNPQTRRTK